MLTTITSFLFVKDKAIWQDVVLSSLCIPFVFWVLFKFRQWYNSQRPLNVLFKGVLDANQVLIFISQLSAADSTLQKISDPKYFTSYPSPTATDRFNLEHKGYRNIDPVWSESDGRCVADIFNVLGNVGKIKNVRVADTQKDWGRNNIPILSIGFNAKTIDLLDICDPINYKGYPINPGEYLQIDGSEKKCYSVVPNDAGIIQKTFFKKSDVPVFLLAGLGTMGTEITGYFFSQNAVGLGKMFGSRAFCVLLSTNATRGREYSSIEAMWPKPSLMRIILHPIVYYQWKSFFPKSVNRN
jgi:hypothetical protein